MATKDAKRVDYRNGLALDSTELEALEMAGVRAQARINPVRQVNGFVLVGEESGGGNKDLGHYVGFLPVAGQPFISSRKLVALGKNAIHRRISARMFVRFEVFRYKGNFVHTWITLHRGDAGDARSQATRQTLFRGKYGELDKKGVATFPSEDGGADLAIPTFLLDGFNAALVGSRCPGCQHAGHFESIGSVKLSEAVLSALHISVPAAARPAEKEAVATLPSTKSRAKAATSTAA